jgi:hypothetical protein
MLPDECIRQSREPQTQQQQAVAIPDPASRPRGEHRLTQEDRRRGGQARAAKAAEIRRRAGRPIEAIASLADRAVLAVLQRDLATLERRLPATASQRAQAAHSREQDHAASRLISLCRGRIPQVTPTPSADGAVPLALVAALGAEARGLLRQFRSRLPQDVSKLPSAMAASDTEEAGQVTSTGQASDEPGAPDPGRGTLAPAPVHDRELGSVLPNAYMEEV